MPENKGKTQGEQHDSAPDSAFSPDLQRANDAWPYLSEKARRTILELVEAAPSAPGNVCGTPGSDGGGQRD
jgi:hypothetical protein